jgi:hypothetical protein
MQPIEQTSQIELGIAHTLDWKMGSQACLEQTFLPAFSCPEHLGPDTRSLMLQERATDTLKKFSEILSHCFDSVKLTEKHNSY